MDYETIDSQLKYDGKVLKVYSDKVKLPNGVVAVKYCKRFGFRNGSC